MSTESTDSTVSDGPTHQKYPDNIGFLIAGEDDVERYYFRTPTGSVAGLRGKTPEMAREILADSTPGFGPDDFEQVEDMHAEPCEYPDPVDSDRAVNEYDIWMLRCGMTTGHLERRLTERRNPTTRMITSILDEWGDPSAIPLDDPVALQQANGIGPSSAGRITGAAVANRLINRPVRYD